MGVTSGPKRREPQYSNPYRRAFSELATDVSSFLAPPDPLTQEAQVREAAGMPQRSPHGEIRPASLQERVSMRLPELLPGHPVWSLLGLMGDPLESVEGVGKLAGVGTWAKHRELLPKTQRWNRFKGQADRAQRRLGDWYERQPNKGLYQFVKENQDPQYMESMDASTLCRKRTEAFQGAVEAQQMELGRALTPDEFYGTRAKLKESGETVPCLGCYRESTYAHAGTTINKFMKKHPELDKSYFLTQDGIDRLAREYPDIHKEFRGSLGSMSIKSPETYAEYAGEVLKWKPQRIERINSQPGGLRWFSSSDYMPEHTLDWMEVAAHMDLRGLKGHAYTKVPDFVETFGNTNLKINMSLMPGGGKGLTPDGKLLFDSTEGMPIETARALRRKFPENAGTVAMGVDDDQIRLLLRSPEVDYVIPYHRSGFSGSRRDKFGAGDWTDYTKFDEKVINKALNKASGKKSVDFEEWMGDTKKYVKLCEERGLSPAFPQFLEEPGYWKLHADVKRMDNSQKKWLPPQKPVQANFSDEALENVLSQVKKPPSSTAKPVKRKK